MWMRDLSGNINPISSVLSSLYVKYNTIHKNFSNDIINNNIKRFDVFYDSIFIETVNGYLFEKIIINNNNNIQPIQNNNNFSPAGNYPIDYWFDETDFKVYILEIKAGIQTRNVFDFYVILNIFDCKTGQINAAYKHRIKLQFTGGQSAIYFGDNNDIPIIETPKICYNRDTKTYNISFIFRNNNGYSIDKGNTIGIVSINIIKSGDFITNEINALVPFTNAVSLISDENII